MDDQVAFRGARSVSVQRNAAKMDRAEQMGSVRDRGSKGFAIDRCHRVDDGPIEKFAGTDPEKLVDVLADVGDQTGGDSDREKKPVRLDAPGDVNGFLIATAKIGQGGALYNPYSLSPSTLSGELSFWLPRALISGITRIPDNPFANSRFPRLVQKSSLSATRTRMSDAEYQIVLHILNLARSRVGLDLMTSDGAAERIRLLVNLAMHASEATAFGVTAALTVSSMRRSDPNSPDPSRTVSNVLRLTFRPPDRLDAE